MKQKRYGTEISDEDMFDLNIPFFVEHLLIVVKELEARIVVLERGAK